MSRVLKGIFGVSLLGMLCCIQACGDENEIQGCTLIGCDSFVKIQLGDVASTYQTGLPILMEVCVNTTICANFLVEQSAGSPATCTQMQSAANAICSEGLSGEVDVMMDLTGQSNSGGQVPTGEKIRDAMDVVVFDELLNAKVDELKPNGEACPPVCYQGTVSYVGLM